MHPGRPCKQNTGGCPCFGLSEWASRQERFHQQKADRKDEPRHEPMLVIHKAHRGHRSCFKVLFEVQKWSQLHKALTCSDVGAASSLCRFQQGGFVQARNHRVARCIFSEARGTPPGVKGRNGGSIQCGEPHEMDRTSFFCHLAGGGHNVIFVVFSIRDDDHGTCGFTVDVKSFPARLDGSTHSCSLHTDHSGVH